MDASLPAFRLTALKRPDRVPAGGEVGRPPITSRHRLRVPMLIHEETSLSGLGTAGGRPSSREGDPAPDRGPGAPYNRDDPQAPLCSEAARPDRGPGAPGDRDNPQRPLCSEAGPHAGLEPEAAGRARLPRCDPLSGWPGAKRMSPAMKFENEIRPRRLRKPIRTITFYDA
jgi:hypothetical protein